MESIEALGKTKYKGTTHRTIKMIIGAVISEAQDRPSAKAVMDLYNTGTFRSIVKRLWMTGVFSSDCTAQSLDCDIPAPEAEEERMSEKPAENPSDKSDWELLVPAEAPHHPPKEEAPKEEASREAVPIEYEISPEEEALPVAKAYPMEEYNDDTPAEAKPAEGTWSRPVLVSASAYSLNPL
jgi:hypothetical protein